MSSGLLLVNKPENLTSFSLVRALRRRLGVKKIGHAGTLDPFAKGLMVMLIGRDYTKLSNRFLTLDKEYVAIVKLGEATDSFDRDGQITETSDLIPSSEEVEAVIAQFQGELMQVPPMFSAKKVGGKKLYDLARAGKTIEREPVKVRMETTLIEYTYPTLTIRVNCSKGTYIRSVAHEMGEKLGSFGHLIELTRTKVGTFDIDQAIPYSLITEGSDKLPLLTQFQ